ncbi:MAG: hypothetical protein V2B18_00495 [Pseudomonadota bacterium]
MIWYYAFLSQSWSDYQVFQELNESRHPNCHKLHYLQMATEKLGKAGLMEITGNSPPKMKHDAFVCFLRHTKVHPFWKKRLGFAQNKRGYAAYIDGMLPIADKIEKLAPAISGPSQPNPEYPWSPRPGDVTCPADYDFPEIKRHELGKITALISNLFRALDVEPEKD